jgi:hypothetical protein
VQLLCSPTSQRLEFCVSNRENDTGSESIAHNGGVLRRVLRYLCNKTLARLKERSNEKRAYPDSAATTLDRLQLRGEAVLLLEIIDI